MSSTTTTTTTTTITANTGTVILGAGIIGVSTAYYLSLSSSSSSSSSPEIHLIDPSPTLFWSASGFAGGFLARNWFAPEVSSLGALSFAEHARLAAAHDGRSNWSYAPSTSLGYSAVAADKGVKKRGDDWLRSGTSRAEAAPEKLLPVLSAEDLKKKTPAWLRRRQGDDVEVIGGEGDAAQLEPERLCRFLLAEAEGRGVKVSQGAEAVEVLREGPEGVVSGVRLRDVKTGEVREVKCSRIIITAGCWSGQVWEKLFGATSKTVKQLPVTSLAGHSLVVKSPRWQGAVDGEGCHAVYTSYDDAFCPEIFSKVGGEIYFAGLNSAVVPLPSVAEGSKVQTESMELVKQAARELLGSDIDGEDDLEVVREGLCFRPVTPWGLPIVARVPDEHLGGGIQTKLGAEGGVFMATGHGPWGISMSLGTGIVMSELVQGRPLSADISALGFEKVVERTN